MEQSARDRGADRGLWYDRDVGPPSGVDIRGDGRLGDGHVSLLSGAAGRAPGISGATARERTLGTVFDIPGDRRRQTTHSARGAGGVRGRKRLVDQVGVDCTVDAGG